MKLFNYSIKLTFAITILTGLMACQTEKKDALVIKNPTGIARPDARVAISRDSLQKYDFEITDHSFLITDSLGNGIAYQLDDLNKNGTWDELALLCSLEANEKKILHFKQVKKNDIPDFTDRANIWFARLDSATKKFQPITHEVQPDWYHRIMKTPFYYQFEGPGWENDRIGFRLYFDQRNAIDIWGKKTSKMVLKNVGLKGDNYHALSSWGMDVLHVGNTLGAGGIAFAKGDSLYKLGATDKTEFQQVADGPVRAIFDIQYDGWHIGDTSYSLRERISIWGGQPGYENKVTLLNKHTQPTLIAGIVTAKLPGKPEFRGNNAFHYVAGWGKQSEHDDFLGMAVVGKSANYTGYGQRRSNAGSVDSSAFLKYKLTPGHPVEYLFVAGSEISDKKFANRKYFLKTVQDEGKRLSNPIKVTFK